MPGRKTRSHFKVQQLPEDLVAAVQAQITAGHTYGEIAAHLQTLGHDVSKSAVARYGAHFLQRVEQLEQSLGMARQVVETNGHGTVDLEEASLKLALNLVLQRLAQVEALDDDVDVLALMNTLARVQSAGVQREKWKAEVRARAEKAAEAVEKQVKRAGLSAAVAQDIRAKILGVADDGQRA